MLAGKAWLLFLSVLIVALSGCTDSQTEPVEQTPVIMATPTPTAAMTFAVPENSTVYVQIFGSRYEPSELEVIKGTTVRWKNMDSAEHTINGINGSNLSSPRLNKWSMWNYTFNESGIFEYNCSVHPYSVKGRLVVK